MLMVHHRTKNIDFENDLTKIIEQWISFGDKTPPIIVKQIPAKQLFNAFLLSS